MSVFRNLLFDVDGKSKLPSAYKEVEYIENTHEKVNSQYIDIGLSPKNYDFNFEFELVSLESNDVWIFGLDLGTGFELGITSNTNNVFYRHSNITIVPDRVNINQRYVCTTTKLTSMRDNKTVYIFARHWDGLEYPAHMRLFNFTAKNGEEIVKNLVPCYRRSDKKPGLYDMITGEFLTNIGSGDFIVGPDV